MKFSEVIEEIKDTGGIIGMVGTPDYFAIPSVKDPMIMLDDDLIPMKNHHLNCNISPIISKWILWDPKPKDILEEDWEVKKVFSPEEREYFSNIWI